jgi:hypothetical protein
MSAGAKHFKWIVGAAFAVAICPAAIGQYAHEKGWQCFSDAAAQYPGVKLTPASPMNEFFVSGFSIQPPKDKHDKAGAVANKSVIRLALACVEALGFKADETLNSKDNSDTTSRILIHRDLQVALLQYDDRQSNHHIFEFFYKEGSAKPPPVVAKKSARTKAEVAATNACLDIGGMLHLAYRANRWPPPNSVAEKYAGKLPEMMRLCEQSRPLECNTLVKMLADPEDRAQYEKLKPGQIPLKHPTIKCRQ